MKILVVNTHVPFIYGGAEAHASNLIKNLKRHGHEVEEIKIPFKWYPAERILDQILGCRLLDLTESCGESIDLVIGLRFPAYYVKHNNKVLWILHQYRAAYDLLETEFSDLLGTVEGCAVREAIVKADDTYIPEAKRIFSNSRNVANRLKRFNNIDSETLYHPPPDYERFYSKDYDNYILYPSRLNPIKRQALAVEAMRHVKSNVKLVVAGAADSENYEKNLREIIQKCDLHDKVKLLGVVPEKEKIELYANALAVLFIPYDEDYGYVTLEAFHSRKAVITCSDSGGPLEFVQDKDTGLVCSPETYAIAKAIDYLAGSKAKAMKYGEAGNDLIKRLDISWDRVVEALTS